MNPWKIVVIWSSRWPCRRPNFLSLVLMVKASCNWDFFIFSRGEINRTSGRYQRMSLVSLISRRETQFHQSWKMLLWSLKVMYAGSCPHPQRSSTGTPFNACSICSPQPDKEGERMWKRAREVLYLPKLLCRIGYRMFSDTLADVEIPRRPRKRFSRQLNRRVSLFSCLFIVKVIDQWLTGKGHLRRSLWFSHPF